jgi:uncharacterized protein with HEPN domain
MPHEPAKYLYDALEACVAIGDFTSGRTRSEYEHDALLRSAVERQFEILGEAFSRLDAIAPEYREQHQEVGRIIGMRNRTIHGYDSVDNDIIWDAIENHVPVLRAWLQNQEPGSENA